MRLEKAPSSETKGSASAPLFPPLAPDRSPEELLAAVRSRVSEHTLRRMAELGATQELLGRHLHQ